MKMWPHAPSVVVDVSFRRITKHSRLLRFARGVCGESHQFASYGFCHLQRLFHMTSPRR